MICSFVAFHDHLRPEFEHTIVAGLRLVLHSPVHLLTAGSLRQRGLTESGVLDVSEGCNDVVVKDVKSLNIVTMCSK